MRWFRYRPATGRASRARSLALVPRLSLAGARGWTFRLSLVDALSLSLSPFPPIDLLPLYSQFLSLAPDPFILSLSPPLSLSLCLASAIGLSGGVARALLSRSPPCVSPLVNSLAAISPAVLVAQEQAEPIMSPRAPRLELFDPIPARPARPACRAVLHRTALHRTVS